MGCRYASLHTAAVAKGYSDALVRRRSWVRFPSAAPFLHSDQCSQRDCVSRSSSIHAITGASQGFISSYTGVRNAVSAGTREGGIGRRSGRNQGWSAVDRASLSDQYEKSRGPGPSFIRTSCRTRSPTRSWGRRTWSSSACACRSWTGPRSSPGWGRSG